MVEGTEWIDGTGFHHSSFLCYATWRFANEIRGALPALVTIFTKYSIEKESTFPPTILLIFGCGTPKYTAAFA